MNRLERWLEKEAIGIEVVKPIIFCAVAYFLYTLSIFFILVLIFGMPERSPRENYSEDIVRLPILVWDFPLVLLYLAAIEEFLFRVILLYLVMLVSRMVLGKRDFGYVLFAIVWSSIYFGYIHGGIIHIFIQGVAGVLFCLVFLKCGGYQGKIAKAFYCSTLCHALVNLLIAYWGLFFWGDKYF